MVHNQQFPAEPRKFHPFDRWHRRQWRNPREHGNIAKSLERVCGDDQVLAAFQRARNQPRSLNC